ncbi:SOUL heme-binding protein [Mucisphaera calidilacus]|uniref:SOUL heme-binding protein n=2 Tax=Mucisphaera calidilacus TaxID=2527982 RepID=A0A518BVV5_9BACT|nr:SOUL heme-binding protein [Mucisphaera calidilacus]
MTVLRWFCGVAMCLMMLVFPGCVRAEIGPASGAEAVVVEPVTAMEAGATSPGDWSVLRVGGEPEHELTVMRGTTKGGSSADYFESGRARISAALPEGYARPTVPGAVELKRYASYRQALLTSEGRGQSGMFWPLFRHISSRDIAMTAPVVMTGRMAGDEASETSMAFLYREPELGPTGAMEDGVVVEDVAPTYVLSVGVMGGRDDERFDALRGQLEAWLAAQGEGGRWVVDGEVRLLGYNGPDVARRYKWWELQLPVRWEAE